MDTKFLSKVTELFIENGAKTVTMDDVAKEFGMSKKTLYQMYKNKEELLEDVLKFKLIELLAKFKQLDYEIENAIERMFCKDDQFERAIESNNSLFIRQLIKYYPEIFNKHMKNFSKKFTEVLVHNIEKGREQGYYREDFSAKIYTMLFFQLMTSYDSSPFIDTTIINRRNFKEEIILLYLNAITNEKGKEVIKKIKNLQEEKT